jgi:hypothetical protein
MKGFDRHQVEWESSPETPPITAEKEQDDGGRVGEAVWNPENDTNFRVLA